MLYFQFDDSIFHIHKFLLVIQYNHFITAKDVIYVVQMICGSVIDGGEINKLCKMTRDHMIDSIGHLIFLLIFISASPHLPEHMIPIELITFSGLSISQDYDIQNILSLIDVLRSQKIPIACISIMCDTFCLSAPFQDIQIFV